VGCGNRFRYGREYGQALRGLPVYFFQMVEAPVPGPDGFLLSPDDPLRTEHLRLNDYLLGEEQRSPQTPGTG
jgi:hypothetical protein